MTPLLPAAVAVLIAWAPAAAAQDKPNRIERTANKAAEATENTANRAAKFVEKTGQRAGKFVEKTATRTGKAVEGAAQSTETWVKKKLE